MTGSFRSVSWFSTKVTAFSGEIPASPAWVEIGHVEAAGIVAHRRHREAQWEIERAGATAHAVRVENPTIDQDAIAVEELAEGKLAGHRLLSQEREQKIGRKPLYVVEAVTLHIECARVSQSAASIRPLKT